MGPRAGAAARCLAAAALLALVAGGCGSDGTPTPGGPDAVGTPDGVADVPGGKDVPTPDKDTQTGPNVPPELERIGDRIVAVGEALVIVVSASDADGDELTYSVYGQLPPGARFIKTERRFEWTPETAGDPVFLTFVVSDGREFDRETVRIEVVESKKNHAPVFEIVGDQTLTASQAFSLQLEATDPDGDTVTYGSDGKLPTGASLDEFKGLFAWTPTSDDAGAPHRVTFTVTDGSLSDSMEVTFVVVTEGGETPEPPVFEPLEPQSVTVGETLTLTLKASDKNGDVVSFAIYEGAPPGATLSGATFSYTASAADAGLAWTTVFSATDGTFTAYGSVDISVKKAPQTTICEDDPGEPNENIANATPLEPGTIERSICDSDLVPIDQDVYEIDLNANDAFMAALSFDPQDGDLDLFLADSGGDIIKSSQTLAATEELSWTATESGKVYLLIAGVGQESFAMGYTLTTSIAEPEECVDDGYDNFTVADAKPIPSADETLAICGGTADWWTIALTCGETLTITLDTAGTGDIDMGLYKNPGVDATPLAQAATPKEVEELELDSVPETGTYYLAVVGYPPGEEEGLYTLDAQHSNACEDDAFAGNSSLATAAGLPAGSEGTQSGLALCCADDWFTLPLQAGDTLTVDVSASGGSVGLTVFEPGGSVQLAAQPPAAGGVIVEVKAETSGVHVLRVKGATGTEYAMEWLIEGEAGPTTCTNLSCDKYSVCDPDSGECVSDFCFEDSECPSGHLCRDTYCINACAADADCRGDLGYACKAFDAGLFCGITGFKGPGESCTSHTSCAGMATCTFKDNGGYCAVIQCLELGLPCPEGTECTIAGDQTLCGLSCGDSADCREDDGYICTPPEDTCLPL